jgi:hypothetical protein
VVVIFRDPLAALESWFRHVKSLYDHFEKKHFQFCIDDFKDLQPGECAPGTRQFRKPDDFERFITICLNTSIHANLCIIFYEDLLSQPEEVFKRLADFLGCDVKPEFFKKVASTCTSDNLREGVKLEPIISQELGAYFLNKWKDNVEYRTPFKSPSYYDLYERLTGRKYPSKRFHSVKVEDPEKLKRKSLFFM